MSILDDAIREHLELKRAHGADEAELKKLEDEAFGPPARPDEPSPFAEAATEFLTTPEGEAGKAVAEAPPSGRREPNIADLQEAPEPPKEEQAAMEHEVIPEPAAEAEPAEPEPQPEPEGSHTTQERQAIAEQPTELFDVEAAMKPGPEAPAETPPEAPSPSDEEVVDAEMSEPRLTPVDPDAGIEATAAEAEAAEEPALEDEEDEDDFFSEQRLSDELNQALEAPVAGEPELGPPTEEHIVPTPHTEEAEAHYAERELEEEDDVEEEEPAAAAEPGSAEHEDVLEDTPDFLEDAPEDDDLWFEQRPPKDFDFDD